jgi:hypothetical protein
MKKHDKIPAIMHLTEEQMEELKLRANENRLTEEDKLFLEELFSNTQEAMQYIKSQQK